MARNVYYPYDFEAHKNLFHKQFPISVYYFMEGAVRESRLTIPWTAYNVRPMISYDTIGTMLRFKNNSLYSISQRIRSSRTVSDFWFGRDCGQWAYRLFGPKI